MFDEVTPLPLEVLPDEWASVYATVRVQITSESLAKRARV